MSCAFAVVAKYTNVQASKTQKCRAENVFCYKVDVVMFVCVTVDGRCDVVLLMLRETHKSGRAMAAERPPSLAPEFQNL